MPGKPVAAIKSFLRTTPPFRQIYQKVDHWLYGRFYPRILADISADYDQKLTDQARQVEEKFINVTTASSFNDNPYLKYSPPGHFYSPIPNLEDLQSNRERIFSTARRTIPGLEIPEPEMLAALADFAKYRADFPPYQENPAKGLRFHFNNGVFEWGEAIIFYSLLRSIRPARVIEVGSGFSSAFLLDINERFFDQSIQCTFIDPYTERMMQLVRPDDLNRITIIPRRLQDLDLEIFETLEENDIAFFDSTHVSKCDSDVNHIFFEVLPRLKPGVLVHFHDIFYPFEYPQRWLLDICVAWNEIYLLRAFLLNNPSFKIEFFNDFLSRFHQPAVVEHLKSDQWLGSSIWLRKTA